MLNLSERTTRIYRLGSPEQGIDLYDPENRVAYQCKSVESGEKGGFNPDKTIESIRAAKRVQENVGWQKYVLCANVDLTGTAINRLRAELPDIEIRPASFWQGLCEKNAESVKRNFKVLVDAESYDTIRLALNDQRFKAVLEDYKSKGSPKYMIDTFPDLSQEEKAEMYDKATLWKKGKKSNQNPYRGSE